MRLAIAPLGSTAEIEAVRAALAAYFKRKWSHVTPAPANPTLTLDDLNFNDQQAQVIADLRHVLEVEIPEHMNMKKQDYGKARAALYEVMGATWGGGLVSKNELYDLEVALPLAKAA